MQIFALDFEGNAIEASKALRHTDYTCLECGAKLRARRSLFLVPHYYHYQSSPSCSQRKKTLTHLNLQLQLQNLLNAQMEVPFPQIKRIADVVHGNTVFEIQISPISKEEIEARTLDYRSLNFKVVWILYDKTFNQTFVTAAEQFLHDHPHYFTDGAHIYDQISLVRKRQRVYRLFVRRVDVSTPRTPIPKFGRKWEVGFENDVLCSNNFSPRDVQIYNEYFKPKRKLHFFINIWKYLLLKAAK